MDIKELLENEMDMINASELEILEDINFELAGGACGYGCTGNV